MMGDALARVHSACSEEAHSAACELWHALTDRYAVQIAGLIDMDRRTMQTYGSFSSSLSATLRQPQRTLVMTIAAAVALRGAEALPRVLGLLQQQASAAGLVIDVRLASDGDAGARALRLKDVVRETAEAVSTCLERGMDGERPFRPQDRARCLEEIREAMLALAKLETNLQAVEEPAARGKEGRRR